MTTFSEKVSHWHDILPQCKERLKSVAIDERSLPFAVSIYEVLGLREQYLKDISGKTDSPSNFHLRISLFDHEFGLFFGKTWKTPSKNYKGYNSINFNKTAFFHSSINREHILLVLELVALWKNDEEHDFEVSCGWGACLAFKSDVCNTEFGSSKKSANILQIDLYPGTPRCLFYIKDLKDFQTDHPPNKLSVSISTQLHPHMHPCLHLIPDNVFFSEADDVPGILPSMGLKRPKLRPVLRSSLEKIEIRLLPSLEEFEETFKRLICEDVLKNLNGPFSHEDIVISRRTLRVGVHNGITFVGPLEDIQMSLNSDVLIKKVSRKLSTKSSLQKKNVLSVAAALLQGSRQDVGDDEMNSLVHNMRVEIDGMLKDINFHFIFALIYEITLPTSDGNDDSAKNRLASIAQPVMEILVRWGVLGPQSQEGMEPGYQEIILLGGPRINPFGDMIYTSNPPIFNENMSGNAVKGNSEVLSFKLHLSEGEDLPPFQSPPSHVVQTPTQLSKDSTIQEKYVKPVLVSPEKKEDDEEEDLREFPSKQGDAKLRIDSDKPEMITEVQTTSTELKELPYFPVQVPILPAFPASKRDLTGNGLSRAAFAQLLTLNFPIVLAANGSPAEVIDPSNLIGQMFLEKEYDDQLKFNEITFQFMAFNRLPMTGGHDSIDAPCTLFFTFQFYRFDLITSERLILEAIDKEISQNNSEVLYVLRKIGGDGSMVDGPPGYQVKFIVDAATVGQAEGRDFYKYLNEQLLHIDVWDADSLFHVGECLLDLKVLLRQGKSAVQSTLELDIWHTEYIEPEMVVTDAVVVKEAVSKPIEIMTSLRGKLLMRTGNVGKKISPSSVDGFKGEFLKKRKESSVTYLSKMIRRSRANRLTEVSFELLQMIASQKQRLSGSSELTNMENVERMKKMRRMEALKKKLMNEDMGDESFPIASLRSETESRQRDLQTVEMYRQNIKPENIKNILNQHITTNIIIKTSLGTTSFFEFPLQNPHNVEVVVLIEWIDPELILITNASEWRHFKTINNVTTPLEEGMFTTPPTQESNTEDSQVVELFLRPKESVHIPFKFLTFRHMIQFHPSRSDFATSSMLTLDKLEDDDDEKNTCKDVLEQGSNNRNIKINFRIKRDMSMLAILNLTVNQQPHIINQIFRLTQPEQTFLKKSFRLPQWPQLTGSQNKSGGNQVFVRCSDPNVICSSSRAAPGNPIDVLIKVACGSAPQVKNFFIAIFTDPRLSKPIQIWQIHVRVMQRVDIAAVQGQTARFTLMIRGSLASRLVRCYSSHPRQMSINPEEPFMLLAGNLQQINVGIRPIKVGVSSMFVNIVDIESHQLVTSWLVHVITQEPIISRQFEINLTIGGPGENKRISFINPYGYQKNFYVHTSHEHLLLFKDNKLELGPTQKGQIGMKFLSSNKPGRVTILVFINDEEDKNEETFAVRVNFKR